MRVTGRLAIGLAILAMGVVSASAQISLSTAVDLALKNDPKLKMAQAEVDKARAALSEARDAYVPSVSAQGGIGKSTGVPQGLPVIFSISSQSLVFNFSQRDYIRTASAALSAALLAEQDMHDQVAEDAVVTYLHLNNAQQRHAALVQEYGYASHLVEIVQARVDAGEDAKIELIRARRAADAAQYERYQLEDEIASLSGHLSRLIGLPGNEFSAIPSSIPAIKTPDTKLDDHAVSYGVESAFANAHSKQEKAFGDRHYWGLPQVALGAGYSRISTVGTNYGVYYPQFNAANLAANHITLNSLSIGIEVKIPLLDMGHQAIARESTAEARHALFEAESQRDQFLEGRFRLSRSAAELGAAEKLAEDDQELAQDQVDTVLLQLSSSSSEAEKPQMTPKDEQNARVQERERTIELLNTQFQLQQAQINLLRQTGELDEWLRNSVSSPSVPTPAPIMP